LNAQGDGVLNVTLASVLAELNLAPSTKPQTLSIAQETQTNANSIASTPAKSSGIVTRFQRNS
jgi:hypothetical protein